MRTGFAGTLGLRGGRTVGLRSSAGCAALAAAVFVSSACACGCSQEPAPCAAVPAAPLAWKPVADRDALASELAAARSAGRGVVVEVWAPWCAYCLEYDELIDREPTLHAGFARLVRLRIDVSRNDQPLLRSALGIPRNLQPCFVFIDAQARLRRRLDVTGYLHEKSAEELSRRLRVLDAPE